jgi:hypothetical protein
MMFPDHYATLSDSMGNKGNGAKLIIPGLFPGLNDIIEARRVTNGKWNAYTDMKTQFDAKVVLFAQMAKFPKVTAPKHFVYHCFEPNKRRDPSNILMGAAKFIEDGLQEAGLLENDGWGQVLSIRGRFYVDAAKPRVELYLYDAEE